MNSLLSGAQMLELDPNDIDDSGRIGFFYPDKAAALGRLMKVDGQRTPISVVKSRKGAEKPWKLVVGMHRNAGARIEGISIFALEATGRSEDLADLEASENLHRRRLEPLERAKFTAALVQAAQDRIAREHGNISHQRRAAKLRWERVKAHEMRPDAALTEEVNDASAKMAEAYGWEQSACEALNMAPRSIHRDLELFRLLIEPFPRLIEALAAHPVVGSNASQLKLLATIREEDMRRRAIEALLADKEMSADDALIAAGLSGETGRKPTDEEKKVNAICGNLGRLTAPQQKRYVSDIAAQLKSDEVKRQLRDLLNQALGDVPDAPTLTPAVSPRMSVKPDYIVCLEDGTRHLNLTARLNKLGMTPGEYRHRWSLPPDYPMVAPNHAMARRAAWKAKLAAIKKAAA